MRWLILAALSLTSLFLVSCKSDESDDLAKAQACLNGISQTNAPAAEACLQHIAQYDSQQANILKCSILLTAGGLVESKVVVAYNALKTNTMGINPSAQFLGALALDEPDAAGGLLMATRADVFCQQTGIRTIKAISSLIVLGSVFNDAAGGFSSPPTQVELDAAILACTPPAVCDPGTVGVAVTSIAQNYCAGADADVDTCNQLEGAIADAGGNNADIGKAVFCYLAGDTYDVGTGLCI